VTARPRLRPALFWRVAAGNAAVLAAACVITALAYRSRNDVAVRELAIFLGGLAVIIGLNLLLLRAAFAPLRQLTTFARTIDPLDPGPRLNVKGGASEAAELAAAFNEMLDRLEAERRESVGRALAAQEGERLRVAQELHDGVGQTLTGVVLQLGRAARDAPDPTRAQVLEAQETARGSLEEVRRIARMLRPEALDDLGLASALHVLGERVAEHSGLEIATHVQPGLPALTPEAELVVYRVAQEALTNVARHAGARHAALRLERVGGRTCLRVEDDGRGPPPDGHEGGGIKGMRERAVLVGGTFSLVGGTNGGTCVTLELE
jgi:two-component system, NarL family, sensor histidine kinase UhpB